MTEIHAKDCLPFAIPGEVSRLRPSASPRNLWWEMQNPRPHPDSQSQNLHFKKILRWFICTLKLEKYQYHMSSNSIEGRRNCQIPLKRWKKFQNNKELMWPTIHHAGLSFRCQTWISETFAEKKKRKETTFAEFEQQLLNFLWHVNGGRIETISWLNKKC